MIDIPKPWLSAVPWESVLTINQTLCQAQKVNHQTNPQRCEQVRGLWEKALPRRMKLIEVLEVCRDCQDRLPFVFNNANTFATIAKTLVEDWLKVLSPIEAQIVRMTVCHYVAGQIGRKELAGVLQHFGPAWRAPAQPQPSPAVVPQPQGAL